MHRCRTMWHKRKSVKNLNVAAMMWQIVKRGWFTHNFNQAALKIYTVSTVSRWAPKISVPKSVSNQLGNASALHLLLGYYVE